MNSSSEIATLGRTLLDAMFGDSFLVAFVIVPVLVFVPSIIAKLIGFPNRQQIYFLNAIALLTVPLFLPPVLIFLYMMSMLTRPMSE